MTATRVGTPAPCAGATPDQGPHRRRGRPPSAAGPSSACRPPPEGPPGVVAARAAGIAFDVVRTGRPSSAEESAALQGIELGRLLRTIVVRRGAGDYVFVLVPGGRQMDWPKLRARLGVKRLSLPDQDEARDATGYERGTITPFGSTNAWPVIADSSVAGLDRVAIGGGARGVNLHLSADALIRAVSADVADVTRPEER